MRIFILESAEQDLKELRAYILFRFSQEQWLATYGRIKGTLTMLARHPQAGTIPEELAEFGTTQYRHIISDKNRIIYEIREHAIFIHIVVDARKDLQSFLARRVLRPQSYST